MNIRLIICSVIFVFAFHITKGDEIVLPTMTNVTQIVVRKADAGWLAVKWITDTQQLQTIVSYINQQRTGWDESLLVTPSMGSTVLDIYDNKGCQASFGIGENFFGAEKNAKVRWKNATEKQRKELLLLVGNIPADLKDVNLPEVSGVTQILVLTNGVVATDRIITDRMQIEKIANFINQQRTGWDRPDAWAAKSLPVVQLQLKNNEGFLREFGIDKDYFETLNYGTDIVSRYKIATKEQKRQLLKLIGLPKE